MCIRDRNNPGVVSTELQSDRTPLAPNILANPADIGPSNTGPNNFEIEILGNLRTPKIRGQYEKMWQSISQSQGKDTKPAGVFAFLSCEPQSHVTEVAGHLGMFVANTTKKRVLLVDGDQRGSRLSMKYSVNKDYGLTNACLLYTSPSPRDLSTSRMPSSA